VRDYSREFAARCKAAGLDAITLGKLRHSNISLRGLEPRTEPAEMAA
jgi:hypothetical protein